MGDKAGRSRWRAVGFRLASVGIGLLPLVLCELSLRALDIGGQAVWDDPFVGFSRVYPLFELDPTRTRYQTASNRLTYFQRDWFSAVKSPREYRIFVFGGSTVQGKPFAMETSFPTWLELSLKAADPSRAWKVVNCGGISYASYRLAPIVEEVMRYGPDLVILCTGHNEFLEDRSYETVKELPAIVMRPLELLSKTRTAAVAGSLARQFTTRERPSRPVLPAEVDAMLDYRGGLARYHRDDAWRAGVEAHYAFNLERMIRTCQRAGVPVLLALPVYNLDCPPFKSAHLASLDQAERDRFEALWDKARDLYARSMPLAIESLRAAARIDPRHAGLHYTLGECLQQLRDFKAARESLLRAKDEDICPLRMTGGLRQGAMEVARRTGVPMIDLVPIFEKRSRGGILGPDWLVDHVHPSVSGHQLIADILLTKMVDLGILKQKSDDWKSRRDALYEKQLSSLGDMYYLKGQAQLERLQQWAAGRARRLRKSKTGWGLTPSGRSKAPRRDERGASETGESRS